MISPPVKISSPALFLLYLSFLKASIVLSIFQPVVKTILFNRSEILIHLGEDEDFEYEYEEDEDDDFEYEYEEEDWEDDKQ